MTKYVTLLLAVGFLIAAAASAQEKTDKDKLQGTWQSVSAEQNGKEQDDAKEYKMIFEGDTFSVKRGDQVAFKGTFKLDPSKKPKTFDLTFTEGPDDLKGKTSPGIYELDGDNFKFCAPEPGTTDRPKEFKTAGTKNFMVQLKREKK